VNANDVAGRFNILIVRGCINELDDEYVESVCRAFCVSPNSYEGRLVPSGALRLFVVTRQKGYGERVKMRLH